MKRKIKRPTISCFSVTTIFFFFFRAVSEFFWDSRMFLKALMSGLRTPRSDIKYKATVVLLLKHSNSPVTVQPKIVAKDCGC